MAIHKTCDGVTRRDVLTAGVIGGTALTLDNFLRFSAAGQVNQPRAKSAIFINLLGGPSHMDTFDLKPESSDEYRGEFQPIATAIPGIEICEHLPKLASTIDKYTILRGVTHSVAAHKLGQQYINTGSRPLPTLEYPGFGAVVAKERPGDKDLPPFVAIPRTAQSPGFLGIKYAALNTGGTPEPGKPFRVRGISLGRGLTINEVNRRNDLLQDLDRTFHGFEKNNDLIGGLDRFGQQAHAMIKSSRAREAFDISKESPAFVKEFGENSFSQSCLLATRLIEAGVRFVTLSYGGWDTHRENWKRLKNKQLPPFDDGLSALFNGLESKGLLDETIVLATGEFGRTPKINQQRGGRDHYPRNMFMLMAGGGVQGGRVLGESDDKGLMPVDEGFAPDDVAASFYTALGIDPTLEYHSNTGRPITLVRDGQVIDELFT